jgi:hypothetical protein
MPRWGLSAMVRMTSSEKKGLSSTKRKKAAGVEQGLIVLSETTGLRPRRDHWMKVE